MRFRDLIIAPMTRFGCRLRQTSKTTLVVNMDESKARRVRNIAAPRFPLEPKTMGNAEAKVAIGAVRERP